ncbi:ATP-binding cassette domain-containing protein [Nonomuraea zeae]|uniref:ABC transporter ATP-binding protein n=1 Tax=Nonomuraea zeae TaxID=1642303 RepID=A0A5S4GP42_9ACTN|nr:ABC transporter ATP-binding protein [Nonomuraea zeae]TMR34321.1 ABC transporter ATP-binding protein [Nonomuraea zeae]
MSSPAEPLLDIKGLTVRYRVKGRTVTAANAFDLDVRPGEIVALTGPSGSGKSTVAHAVLGLLPTTAEITAGRITFAGQSLAGLPERRMRALRGSQIALIPQDPGAALNPVQRVGAQVAEALIVNGLAGRRDAPAAVMDLLAEAGVPDPGRRAGQYPHELSGGLRQRVLIAIAIAARPRLIVADEPTSALDSIVRGQILDLVESLARAARTSVLIVTHDPAAAGRADRVVTMGADVRPRLRPAAPVAPASAEAHLRVEGLVKEYRPAVRAVDEVSFTLPAGQTLALIGESGSGKSTVARMVLGLVEPTAGRIMLGDTPITGATGARLRELRRHVQIVYQNPFTSLNPRMTVRQIVTDPLASYRIGTRAERRARAAELLDRVGLPAALLDRRPRELSGGQRQRVAIARALALSPDLLICDEPTSALDAAAQDHVLALLARLQDDLGLTYLFISHDFAAVRRLAHHVAVIRDGRLVETGPAARVLAAPRHPHTQALLAAAPASPALQS